MANIEFHVTGWAAWSPVCALRREWLDWACAPLANDDESDSKTSSVPTILRRRISPVGQKALHGAFGLSDVGNARFVLSSRHGEFGRTLTMLTALADREAPSPADFSLSVHHSLVGLLSIAVNNRLGHTAVAAGRESFAYGLLEAATAAAEQPQIPVILLHFDEPLPPDYIAIDGPQERALAVALRIEPPSQSTSDDIIAMKASVAAREDVPSDSLGLKFLWFFLSGAQTVGAVGDRLRWHWSRDAVQD